MTMQPFTVPFGLHSLQGDGAGPSPRVLCLHGAGQADRRRYDALRAVLDERGLGSVAFDMIGVGQTGGELRSSSLKERTEQAEAVIAATLANHPLSIIAGSMSGYTAVRLTHTQPVDKLVLIVPAAYAADAYELPFNAGFTERIRQSQSWHDSDSFRILSEFSGRTLIVDAGQDAVIPTELVDQLMVSAQHPQRLTIAAAPHKIFTYLAQHPADERSVYAAIADFLA